MYLSPQACTHAFLLTTRGCVLNFARYHMDRWMSINTVLEVLIRSWHVMKVNLWNFWRYSLMAACLNKTQASDNCLGYEFLFNFTCSKFHLENDMSYGHFLLVSPSKECIQSKSNIICDNEKFGCLKYINVVNLSCLWLLWDYRKVLDNWSRVSCAKNNGLLSWWVSWPPYKWCM